ncbi:GAD-like domain-containing protein [Deinococcus sp.]|uniref:GAD-like domain-containing protein n=1 Tax=Deinococcus sp. TaxID=47478 RepID=UPI003B5B5BDC
MYEDMNLLGFEFFVHKHGYQKYADVALETIEKYKGILPDFMLAVWERYGLSSHGEGYIWTVNPDDYSEIIREFFGKEHPLVVFARSSFGDLWAVQGDREYKVMTHYGHAFYFGETDLDSLFSFGIMSLGDEKHAEHLKVLKKLGPIDQDHMYGYVPMLALGGDGSLKETKIVKTREYLALVADTVTEANRNGWNPLGLKDEEAS